MRVDWHRSGFAIPDSSMNPNVFLSYVRICFFFFFLRLLFPISKLKGRANRIKKNIYIYFIYLRDIEIKKIFFFICNKKF